jgi:hypothetical protein
MLACCLIPLTALAVIYVFDLPINSVLYFGVILLCPLLHFVMMRGMMGHDHQHADHRQHAGYRELAPVAQETQWGADENEEPLK